ncbi:TrkH family potassium uptake protein [Enterococcus dongliensis]|uniref:TrkH family potassium uptake protein n=1 Tax=Enterococcus dongliensis TaxID=2559925 RepID=A0AAP5KN91_9ENTE|nr:TrkH family potassium uptake protein [Enterococcus dongliensis]MDT2595532.1 TrkH family potassium uptake protein [Enterococcus dongliensis]MDT2603252.1 TrkH family potassium uptake protein [Enterococcus dongliensis]MDT2633615.1 TrkH family potassium uptake protein [Enterococcus dongliensis]MDT2636011.1 TrkH family potassium uptake protein [Enterococcus dongliensis]MDT2639715.1 TrkH family potassium uptake protein [Enterococcus dongliensis]
MNRKMVVFTIGKLLKVEALLLLLPCIVGVIYHEQAAIAYLVVAVFTFLVGTLLSWKKPKNQNIFAKEGFFIVGISWTLLSLFGALPFMLSGEIPSFTDAFFETVSGFTTTGSSILPTLSGISQASLFWRSFTHWIGGMGILVFTVAFIPIASGRTMHILKAEMPGPIIGKLVSKVSVTARILYVIYTVLTLIQILLLMLGDMPIFDSILNSFATAGTGGFAMSDAGIAGYNSAYIDGVLTIFMILFGINFNLIYFFIFGKILLVLKSEELRGYLAIIALSTLLITINISSQYPSYLKAFRYAAFQVASIITTTGFTTTNYDLWPMFSQVILLLLMFVGACAGSTGGGIKVSRIQILIKHAVQELKKILHSHSVTSLRYEGETISAKTMGSIHAYLVLYSLVFISSLLILSLENSSFQTIFSAVATCINNVGPGFESVGPTGNFGFLSDVSKWTLSFAMLAGRLEMFPMLLLFSKPFWKS